jgi:hypothetical protein
MEQAGMLFPWSKTACRQLICLDWLPGTSSIFHNLHVHQVALFSLYYIIIYDHFRHLP